jgi:hypothetical protein
MDATVAEARVLRAEAPHVVDERRLVARHGHFAALRRAVLPNQPAS